MSFFAALPAIGEALAGTEEATSVAATAAGAGEATGVVDGASNEGNLSRSQNFKFGMSDKDNKPKKEDITAQIYSGIRSANGESNG